MIIEPRPIRLTSHLRKVGLRVRLPKILRSVQDDKNRDAKLRTNCKSYSLR